MNLPNWLTVTRVILIPVCIALFYLPVSWGHWAAAAVFIVAAITDWLDGYLARKLDQSSPFGAFLDPVADKLIVASALVALVDQMDTLWVAIPAMIIIGREIVISALREWMAELGKRASVAVSMIGKLKTTLQMVAIIVLLSQSGPGWITTTGIILMQAAALLTLYSMMVYLKAAWPEFDLDKKSS